jgi:4-diphosphocytidyl-2-C-methyl-D-erythritol kinase
MLVLGMGHKKPPVSLETAGHTWYWVLWVPPSGLSAKKAFARYDQILAKIERNDYPSKQRSCPGNTCGTAPPESLLTAFVNDPELPAKELLPDIAVALKAGLTAGAVASLVMGSGSTCALLTKMEPMRGESRWHCRESAFREVVVASGPVEGVRVTHG